jgi:hypothetical protein
MNFEFSGLGQKTIRQIQVVCGEDRHIWWFGNSLFHQKFQRMDSSYALKTMAGPGVEVS